MIRTGQTLLLLFILLILFSCHVRKNKTDQRGIQIELCDSKLSAFKNKYDFGQPLDSLKKIQPCVSELMSDTSEEVINRNLFDYIRKNYLAKLEENQYELFYKRPENNVALYNFLNETEKVEEIENGIKINDFKSDK